MGSSQSIAGPLVALNTIVAESLDVIASHLEKETAGGTPFNAAVQALLKQIVTDHGAVIFNGDGYSEAWHAEAARRGLPNLRTSVEALPMLDDGEVKALFERYGVLSRRELQSRLDVYLEHYCKSIAVEARTTLEMAHTIVYPAAVRYLGELAATGASLGALGCAFDARTLGRVAALTTELQDGCAALEAALAREKEGDLLSHARHAAGELLPAMAAVRKAADELEGLVADDLWPLATYQEMLFVK